MKRFSPSSLQKLGTRLRKAEQPSDEDLFALQEFRAAHDPALASVKQVLRSMGIEATPRLKTSSTILEKLIREKTRLGSMQDIAGVRIVRDMSLAEQDEMAGSIIDRLGQKKVDDRRARPSHGYRAVHVVVEVDGFLVEIQIRTLLQNLWAQIMETLGDRIGRGIRYGELPKEPLQRRAVEDLIKLSTQIAEVEQSRADLAEDAASLQEPSPDADEYLQEEFKARRGELEHLEQEINRHERTLKEGLGAILRALEGR